MPHALSTAKDRALAVVLFPALLVLWVVCAALTAGVMLSDRRAGRAPRHQQ